MNEALTVHLINHPFKNTEHFHPLPATSRCKINFSEDLHLTCLQHLDLAFKLETIHSIQITLIIAIGQYVSGAQKLCGEWMLDYHIFFLNP